MCGFISYLLSNHLCVYFWFFFCFCCYFYFVLLKKVIVQLWATIIVFFSNYIVTFVNTLLLHSSHYEECEKVKTSNSRPFNAITKKLEMLFTLSTLSDITTRKTQSAFSAKRVQSVYLFITNKHTALSKFFYTPKIKT